MEKIISAKEAARQTIKARMEKEIPPINEAIKKAMANGFNYIYYDGIVSEETAMTLKKAGYLVDDWDKNGVSTEISWRFTCNKLTKDDSEFESILREVGLDIVKMQQPQKIR